MKTIPAELWVTGGEMVSTSAHTPGGLFFHVASSCGRTVCLCAGVIGYSTPERERKHDSGGNRIQRKGV